MVPNNKMRVLIVDDDASMANYLTSYLSRRNFEASIAASGEEAIRMFRVSDPHMVLLDVAMSGIDGIETLERIKQIKPDVSVIMISAQNNPDVIFRASKLGADDYILKPFEPKELDLRINKVIDKQRLVSEVTQLREQVRRQSDFAMLFGTSPKMEEVKMTIEQVADTTATVLIRGESGTGKEVVARMIYTNSSRRDKPFVKVNCAAIPHELLESELFGYEPGAFTGASRQKLGKFDQANYGTIFLDEISEMHPALQAKLLHVLQDGEFARLGGKRDIAVDVRVLSATNKPLERAVEDGVFREDLFYRLNVVTIHIPPLRERREEIPVFLDFFLRKYSEYYGKQPAPFSDYAVGRMMEYSWPGNIRELENLVKRYVIVGNEPQIIRELSTHKPIMSSLPGSKTPEQAPEPATPPIPIEMTMPSLLEIGKRAAMQAEREAIERVLAQTRWNRRQAAKILKISYKALLNKLKAMEEHNQLQSKQHPA
ncbi:MAG TPA: sigma-54 dependent transcriptional regulator [Terriglobales bacterium]|jgi:DNA-binding NtrC family response regulator|nr:sigma-54 dependent transcriptional regulator [Terriglobales bacterium]